MIDAKVWLGYSRRFLWNISHDLSPDNARNLRSAR
jgi:hypothetical protein